MRILSTSLTEWLSSSDLVEGIDKLVQDAGIKNLSWAEIAVLVLTDIFPEYGRRFPQAKTAMGLDKKAYDLAAKKLVAAGYLSHDGKGNPTHSNTEITQAGKTQHNKIFDKLRIRYKKLKKMPFEPYLRFYGTLRPDAKKDWHRPIHLIKNKFKTALTTLTHSINDVVKETSWQERVALMGLYIKPAGKRAAFEYVNTHLGITKDEWLAAIDILAHRGFAIKKSEKKTKQTDSAVKTLQSLFSAKNLTDVFDKLAVETPGGLRKGSIAYQTMNKKADTSTQVTSTQTNIKDSDLIQQARMLKGDEQRVLVWAKTSGGVKTGKANAHKVKIGYVTPSDYEKNARALSLMGLLYQNVVTDRGESAYKGLLKLYRVAEVHKAEDLLLKIQQAHPKTFIAPQKQELPKDLKALISFVVTGGGTQEMITQAINRLHHKLSLAERYLLVLGITKDPSGLWSRHKEWYKLDIDVMREALKKLVNNSLATGSSIERISLTSLGERLANVIAKDVLTLDPENAAVEIGHALSREQGVELIPWDDRFLKEAGIYEKAVVVLADTPKDWQIAIADEMKIDAVQASSAIKRLINYWQLIDSGTQLGQLRLKPYSGKDIVQKVAKHYGGKIGAVSGAQSYKKVIFAILTGQNVKEEKPAGKPGKEKKPRSFKSLANAIVKYMKKGIEYDGDNNEVYVSRVTLQNENTDEIFNIVEIEIENHAVYRVAESSLLPILGFVKMHKSGENQERGIKPYTLKQFYSDDWEEIRYDKTVQTYGSADVASIKKNESSLSVQEQIVLIMLYDVPLPEHRNLAIVFGLEGNEYDRAVDKIENLGWLSSSNFLNATGQAAAENILKKYSTRDRALTELSKELLGYEEKPDLTSDLSLTWYEYMVLVGYLHLAKTDEGMVESLVQEHMSIVDYNNAKDSLIATKHLIANKGRKSDWKLSAKGRKEAKKIVDKLHTSDLKPNAAKILRQYAQEKPTSGQPGVGGNKEGVVPSSMEPVEPQDKVVAGTGKEVVIKKVNANALPFRELAFFLYMYGYNHHFNETPGGSYISEWDVAYAISTEGLGIQIEYEDEMSDEAYNLGKSLENSGLISYANEYDSSLKKIRKSEDLFWNTLDKYGISYEKSTKAKRAFKNHDDFIRRVLKVIQKGYKVDTISQSVSTDSDEFMDFAIRMPHGQSYVLALIKLTNNSKERKKTAISLLKTQENIDRTLAGLSSGGHVLGFNLSDVLITPRGEGTVKALMKKYNVSSLELLLLAIEDSYVPDKKRDSLPKSKQSNPFAPNLSFLTDERLFVLSGLYATQSDLDEMIDKVKELDKSNDLDVKSWDIERIVDELKQYQFKGDPLVNRIDEITSAGKEILNIATKKDPMSPWSAVDISKMSEPYDSEVLHTLASVWYSQESKIPAHELFTDLKPVDKDVPKYTKDRFNSLVHWLRNLENYISADNKLTSVGEDALTDGYAIDFDVSGTNAEDIYANVYQKANGVLYVPTVEIERELDKELTDDAKAILVVMATEELCSKYEHMEDCIAETTGLANSVIFHTSEWLEDRGLIQSYGMSFEINDNGRRMAQRLLKKAIGKSGDITTDMTMEFLGKIGIIDSKTAKASKKYKVTDLTKDEQLMLVAIYRYGVPSERLTYFSNYSNANPANVIAELEKMGIITVQDASIGFASEYDEEIVERIFRHYKVKQDPLGRDLDFDEKIAVAIMGKKKKDITFDDLKFPENVLLIHLVSYNRDDAYKFLGIDYDIPVRDIKNASKVLAKEKLIFSDEEPTTRGKELVAALEKKHFGGSTLIDVDELSRIVAPELKPLGQPQEELPQGTFLPKQLSWNEKIALVAMYYTDNALKPKTYELLDTLRGYFLDAADELTHLERKGLFDSSSNILTPTGIATVTEIFKSYGEPMVRDDRYELLQGLKSDGNDHPVPFDITWGERVVLVVGRANKGRRVKRKENLNLAVEHSGITQKEYKAAVSKLEKDRKWINRAGNFMKSAEWELERVSKAVYREALGGTLEEKLKYLAKNNNTLSTAKEQEPVSNNTESDNTAQSLSVNAKTLLMLSILMDMGQITESVDVDKLRAFASTFMSSLSGAAFDQALEELKNVKAINQKGEPTDYGLRVASSIKKMGKQDTFKAVAHDIRTKPALYKPIKDKEEPRALQPGEVGGFDPKTLNMEWYEVIVLAAYAGMKKSWQKYKDFRKHFSVDVSKRLTAEEYERGKKILIRKKFISDKERITKKGKEQVIKILRANNKYDSSVWSEIAHSIGWVSAQLGRSKGQLRTTIPVITLVSTSKKDKKPIPRDAIQRKPEDAPETENNERTLTWIEKVVLVATGGGYEEHQRSAFNFGSISLQEFEDAYKQLTRDDYYSSTSSRLTKKGKDAIALIFKELGVDKKLDALKKLGVNRPAMSDVHVDHYKRYLPQARELSAIEQLVLLTLPQSRKGEDDVVGHARKNVLDMTGISHRLFSDAYVAAYQTLKGKGYVDGGTTVNEGTGVKIALNILYNSGTNEQTIEKIWKEIKGNYLTITATSEEIKQLSELLSLEAIYFLSYMDMVGNIGAAYARMREIKDRKVTAQVFKELRDTDSIDVDTISVIGQGVLDFWLKKRKVKNSLQLVKAFETDWEIENVSEGSVNLRNMGWEELMVLISGYNSAFTSRRGNINDASAYHTASQVGIDKNHFNRMLTQLRLRDLLTKENKLTDLGIKACNQIAKDARNMGSRLISVIASKQWDRVPDYLRNPKEYVDPTPEPQDLPSMEGPSDDLIDMLPDDSQKVSDYDFFVNLVVREIGPMVEVDGYIPVAQLWNEIKGLINQNLDEYKAFLMRMGQENIIDFIAHNDPKSMKKWEIEIAPKDARGFLSYFMFTRDFLKNFDPKKDIEATPKTIKHPWESLTEDEKAVMVLSFVNLSYKDTIDLFKNSYSRDKGLVQRTIKKLASKGLMVGTKGLIELTEKDLYDWNTIWKKEFDMEVPTSGYRSAISSALGILAEQAGRVIEVQNKITLPEPKYPELKAVKNDIERIANILTPISVKYPPDDRLSKYSFKLGKLVSKYRSENRFKSGLIGREIVDGRVRSKGEYEWETVNYALDSFSSFLRGLMSNKNSLGDPIEEKERKRDAEAVMSSITTAYEILKEVGKRGSDISQRMKDINWRNKVGLIALYDAGNIEKAKSLTSGLLDPNDVLRGVGFRWMEIQNIVDNDFKLRDKGIEIAQWHIADLGANSAKEALKILSTQRPEKKQVVPTGFTLPEFGGADKMKARELVLSLRTAYGDKKISGVFAKDLKKLYDTWYNKALEKSQNRKDLLPQDISDWYRRSMTFIDEFVGKRLQDQADVDRTASALYQLAIAMSDLVEEMKARTSPVQPEDLPIDTQNLSWKLRALLLSARDMETLAGVKDNFQIAGGSDQEFEAALNILTTAQNKGLLLINRAGSEIALNSLGEQAALYYMHKLGAKNNKEALALLKKEREKDTTSQDVKRRSLGKFKVDDLTSDERKVLLAYYAAMGKDISTI